MSPGSRPNHESPPAQIRRPTMTRAPPAMMKINPAEERAIRILSLRFSFHSPPLFRSLQPGTECFGVDGRHVDRQTRAASREPLSGDARLSGALTSLRSRDILRRSDA